MLRKMNLFVRRAPLVTTEANILIRDYSESKFSKKIQ